MVASWSSNLRYSTTWKGTAAAWRRTRWNGWQLIINWSRIDTRSFGNAWILCETCAYFRVFGRAVTHHGEYGNKRFRQSDVLAGSAHSGYGRNRIAWRLAGSFANRVRC